MSGLLAFVGLLWVRFPKSLIGQILPFAVAGEFASILQSLQLRGRVDSVSE
jgi:hypothetical protein